jgi:hypothetical protein
MNSLVISFILGMGLITVTLFVRRGRRRSEFFGSHNRDLKACCSLIQGEF